MKYRKEISKVYFRSLNCTFGNKFASSPSLELAKKQISHKRIKIQKKKEKTKIREQNFSRLLLRSVCQRGKWYYRIVVSEQTALSNGRRTSFDSRERSRIIQEGRLQGAIQPHPAFFPESGRETAILIYESRRRGHLLLERDSNRLCNVSVDFFHGLIR